VRELYRALWRFAAGKRHLLFVSTTLLTLAEVSRLAIPWLAGQAINTVQREGTDGLPRAGMLMAAVFGVSVAAWCLHGPGRFVERSVAVRVRETLSDTLFRRLVGLPLAWHETHHSGETLHRVDRTTQALTGFAQNQFVYLQNVVSLVGPVVALALLSWQTGLAAAAGYALIGIVILRFDAAMMRLADAENRGERRYSAALVDFLGNVGTVLALRLQQAAAKLLGERLVAVFEPLKRSIVVNESKWASVDLANVALWCSLVALYAWLAQRGDGTLLLGNVFMVYQYAQQAGGVVVSIAANYQQFARYQVDYASAAPIWDAAPPPPRASGIDRWSALDVRDLAFTHARRRGSGPSLEVAQLALRRGERIALIGPSGAGKSTLMRALAGLYAPDRVRIEVDGAARADLADLASIATLVPQDAEVFEGTLRENLAFGAPVDDAAVASAISIAGLGPLVASLPSGLDTPIAERGANFSGGQKQRIALARGLLAARDSTLVLLDEPTASLDPVSEAEVYAALDRERPDACVVSSIHRLHLLPRFDRVVLMADGAIVDDGTLAALLERSALMRSLWREARRDRDAAPAAVPPNPPPIG
jgi:ABC-type multidrug transport system fused ATPase/permease subunit